MRIYRTFHPQVLEIKLPHTLELSSESFHHLCKVLRLNDGEQIHMVDNSCGHYIGTLINVTKKTAFVKLTDYVKSTNESNLNIHLLQVISRGDRMDFTIQKAVELGVKEITPLFSDRCEVTLKGERLEKKVQYWQNVVISACLQSYRDFIPKVNPPIKLSQWYKDQQSRLDQSKVQGVNVLVKELYCNLNPFAGTRLIDIKSNFDKIHLLIGSEGGLSDAEIEQAKEVGFTDYNLGPRVLRTETAALTAISILQAHLGDI